MNLTEIKDALTTDAIRNILSSYGVEPYQETETYFVYPTVCHNPEHGSNKLYYYFDSKIFMCYTECDEAFNIFQMIQKLEKHLGNTINVFEAAKKIGFDSASIRKKTLEEIASEKHFNLIDRIVNQKVAPQVDYESLENEILDYFKFDRELLKPWLSEGMSEEALRSFEIGYSIKDLAISIPHRDYNNNLIGVRGRFMSENAPNKYMPLTHNGQLLTHSIRGNLYGLNRNLKNIQEKGRVVLYESEKSVLLHESYFGSSNNISAATCGNRISAEQIQLLLKTGAEEVILAFDQDFKTAAERDTLFEKYYSTAEQLTQYFSVSIIMDWTGLVGYKDSPIDKGKDIFDKLYSNRSFI